MLAFAVVPGIGAGLGNAIGEKASSTAEPQTASGSSSAAYGVNANGAAGITLSPSPAPTDQVDIHAASEVDGAQHEASGSSFPWKGVLIVGAAVLVTAVLIVAAPVTVPMAIAIGGATLIAASSYAELGECVFGDGKCSDALIAPRAAFDVLSYPFLHPKETVVGLATLGNDLVVQPGLECLSPAGLATSKSCGDALRGARNAGGQVLSGLRDAAVTAWDCGSSGDAKACGETGAAIAAAFGIPAGATFARSKIATDLAARDTHPRLATKVAPRKLKPEIRTAYAERELQRIATRTELAMCNAMYGTCAPAAVMNGKGLERAGFGSPSVVEYYLPGRRSSHAIAQATMPDGTPRYVSWGTVYGEIDEIAGTKDYKILKQLDPEGYRQLDRGPFGSEVPPDMARVSTIYHELQEHGVVPQHRSSTSRVPEDHALAGTIYRAGENEGDSRSLTNGSRSARFRVRRGDRVIEYDRSGIVSVTVDSQGLAAPTLSDSVVGSSVPTGARTVRSLIRGNKKLEEGAQEAGRSFQKSLDSLTAQLQAGNLNPGIGTKQIRPGIKEARARDGARVYFRENPDGSIDILGKSGKSNQDKIIKEVDRVFGSK